MKAWRREQMPRRFHYGTHPTRLTNIIVIPETGWTLDYAAETRPVRKRGTHGFDNRDRDTILVWFGDHLPTLGGNMAAYRQSGMIGAE